MSSIANLLTIVILTYERPAALLRQLALYKYLECTILVLMVAKLLDPSLISSVQDASAFTLITFMTSQASDLDFICISNCL